MRPRVPSASLTQSPTWIELSSWSARPPITLPSVSWSENPMTAVRTADVVMTPESGKPSLLAMTMIATIPTAAAMTSRRIRGARTPARGRTIPKTTEPKRPAAATTAKIALAIRTSLYQPAFGSARSPARTGRRTRWSPTRMYIPRRRRRSSRARSWMRMLTTISVATSTKLRSSTASSNSRETYVTPSFYVFVAGLTQSLALDVALDVHLGGPRQRQRPRRDVLGHRGAGADIGPGTDGDRGDELGVRADEGAVGDGGLVLGDAVVVAG